MILVAYPCKASKWFRSGWGLNPLIVSIFFRSYSCTQPSIGCSHYVIYIHLLTSGLILAAVKGLPKCQQQLLHSHGLSMAQNLAPNSEPIPLKS
jgi:hypothetical protein